MDLTAWFAIQQVLDDRILQEHCLQRTEIFLKKILALQVEIGELANETRCFKYWSRKSPSPRESVLEEFVDALHFVLSLGLDLGHEDLELPAVSAADDLTAGFLELTAASVQLAKTQGRDEYRELFAALLAVGYGLGFSNEEIGQAYLAKNEINHQRQQEGY
jgi:dimeric dUTPase (all-alpha-NTP-PPase superfamily)